MRGARVESRAGGEEEAAPARRRLRTCIPAGPASGRRSLRALRSGRGCGRTRGQVGAGAEFLQSLTWLPFRCCSRARQRGARQAAAARWRV